MDQGRPLGDYNSTTGSLRTHTIRERVKEKATELGLFPTTAIAAALLVNEDPDEREEQAELLAEHEARLRRTQDRRVERVEPTTSHRRADDDIPATAFGERPSVEEPATAPPPSDRRADLRPLPKELGAPIDSPATPPEPPPIVDQPTQYEDTQYDEPTQFDEFSNPWPQDPLSDDEEGEPSQKRRKVS